MTSKSSNRVMNRNGHCITLATMCQFFYKNGFNGIGGTCIRNVEFDHLNQTQTTVTDNERLEAMIDRQSETLLAEVTLFLNSG